MTLSAYLESKKETPSAFARRIGVSAVAVHRYLHHERIPDREVMGKIVDATAGNVQANDFYDLEPHAPKPTRRRRAAGSETRR